VTWKNGVSANAAAAAIRPEFGGDKLTGTSRAMLKLQWGTNK